jgi:hypothetical protein
MRKQWTQQEVLELAEIAERRHTEWTATGYTPANTDYKKAAQARLARDIARRSWEIAESNYQFAFKEYMDNRPPQYEPI